MQDEHFPPARGVLKESTSPPPFSHARMPPDETLDDLIEFFWHVRWDLPDEESFTQRVLSHPSVNIVYEPERMYVSGVSTACFVRTLEGKGDVFSIKLHPGHASRLFLSTASTLTDIDTPLVDLLDSHHVETLHALLTTTQHFNARVEHASAFLRNLCPPATQEHIDAQRIVAWIESHPDALLVQDVCTAFSLHKRALQRLFARHVGVSPKWVIGRYRMHEAAIRLESGDDLSLTTLAHALGYFDQAHFTRDFKRVTGDTPSSYRARCSSDFTAPE